MIRKFEIWNDKFNKLEGYLSFNTETEEFSMRILEDYTGKHPDIFFKLMNEQGIVDVPQHFVNRWVNGRVFPPNRQGIRGMLKEMGLKEYNVFDILMYNEGGCQMDYSYLKEVTDHV